jgi:hypothetical protein
MGSIIASSGPFGRWYMLHIINVILVMMRCIAVDCRVEQRGTCVENILFHTHCNAVMSPTACYTVMKICGISMEGKFMVWPRLGFLQAESCWYELRSIDNSSVCAR